MFNRNADIHRNTRTIITSLLKRIDVQTIHVLGNDVNTVKGNDVIMGKGKVVAYKRAHDGIFVDNYTWSNKLWRELVFSNQL